MNTARMQAGPSFSTKIFATVWFFIWSLYL